MKHPISKLIPSSKVLAPTSSSSRTKPKHTNKLTMHSCHLGFARGRFSHMQADEEMINEAIMMLIYGPNPKNSVLEFLHIRPAYAVYV